jgi:DNA-binding transcriptional ArsR family regulator
MAMAASLDALPPVFFRLTYAHMGMYCLGMARAATTSDAFNAVAEPRRRAILAFLADREQPVTAIVVGLAMEQPSVSKHLRVLRDVGLVRMRREGRRKLYRTNAAGLRPLHEWTGEFERFWRHTLTKVKERAEAKMAEANAAAGATGNGDGNGGGDE